MDLNELSLTELREMAKEKGMKNVTKLKKEELINELQTDTVESESPYKLTNPEDQIVEGILEVMPDGYGFLRGDNYLPSPKDVYISPVQIRRFNLDTGDKVKGISRTPKEGEKFPALIFVGEVNGQNPENAFKRKHFDDLIPIYANKRMKLETTPLEFTMRLVDLMAPIGKGQRGMIVAPPKARKNYNIEKNCK